ASRGALLRRRSGQEGWEVAAIRHFPADARSLRLIPDWEGFPQALAGPFPFVLEDIETEIADDILREAARQEGYGAVSLLPLVGSGDHLLGMVLTFFPHPHQLSAVERHLLRLYSRHVSAALERALEWEARQKESLEHERQEEEKVYIAASARCLLWYAEVV